MKQFDCGTLVPGCTWHTRAEDGNEAELVRRATEHLRSAHGETEIRPAMIEAIKARIAAAAPAQA
jgi:predicted small metal-binding protein